MSGGASAPSSNEAGAAGIAPEDAARAHWYALLARLFSAPADAALLAAIASADAIEAQSGGLASAWQALREAAGRADPEAVREEYEALFVGTGKALVTPYTTAYTIRYASESRLAALRSELDAIGLARLEDVYEPEDHIAALAEVMRHLIVEHGSDLAVQKKFFERWVRPGAIGLCDAINNAEVAVFYKAVARLASELFEIEHAAYEMI
jgi:TorA maturation chaperone TorD